MAVEELYLIGETYLAPIEHDNLYSHYMDRLHGMTELYSELSDILDQTLNEKLNQLSFPVVKEIARAMLCLSRPISLLSETSMFFTFRDTARRWRIRRHYGIACLLIKRYLLVHPHMVPSFSGEFLDDWKAFLKRWQGAFHKFKIDKSLAYLKLQVNGCDIMETQLLLPRALLRVPAILEEVRKDGRKDCISRPLLFMEHDAGIPWTCVAVTKGQTDILGRSRAHIMFFDGQTPTEIVSGRLVQKLTEQDIFENNHFLGKFDDGGCLGRGLSPLSLAAMKGYRGIFEKIHHAMPDLLSKSFLKDAIRDVMRTHLHWAASCGQTETVRFLCSNYHVRLLHDSEDAEGKTAIHLASEFNHVRVMQCLLECITSTATEELIMEIIDSTDNYGRTAFWYAAKKGHVDILRLLEPYADTGRRATNGHTPLSIACFKGHTEVARYLLGLPIELRPDVNGTNGHRTPFYNAKIGGHTDCIEILREHGAIDARLAPSDVDDDNSSFFPANLFQSASSTIYPIVPARHTNRNMGQGQSQPQAAQRAPEPEISEGERAKVQAEMRAKQQAALDKRFANPPKKTSSAAAQTTRKPSALEEASRENIGWRNADAQAEFRNWN
ncbi:ankyrin repeat-containing protein [Stemphylium lycopersici]|uniref:Ankyrin repeat-containing protein n=1 Tax=Stemphylium lycopersici TaxID=183478 RepID=A0A364N237_STELY|nr:ankyrin repeat-containing protein [Stemphylium lycopersici]